MSTITNNNTKIIVNVKKCEACGSECSTACGHCKKVNYCSVTCQKSNRKVHKRVCYPAELVKGGPNGGYYLRTTRDIGPNELIYAEPVVIIGPNYHLPQKLKEIGVEYIPICLGCHKACKPNITCERCQWPVCGKECQENPGHKLRECPILVRGELPRRMDQTGDYVTIGMIRILLLKKRDPVTWDLIMKLESPLKIKNQREDANLTPEAKQTREFVTTHIFQSYFGFNHVTSEEIHHVQEIWKDLAMEPGPNEKLHDRWIKMLTPFFHLLSQSCTMNTKHFLMGNNLDKLQFRIYATTKISAGSPLMKNPLRANMMHGTLIRRAQIFKNYGTWCNCERCKDPTENGSYLSALKCPEHRDINTDSYLLPIDPLNHESDWNCTNRNCKAIYKSSKIHQILKPIQKKFGEFMKRASDSNFEAVIGRRNKEFKDEVDDKLIYEMLKYDEELMKTLHRNHYIRFILRKFLLYGIGHTVAEGIKNPSVGHVFCHRENRAALTERMYEIAQDCLPIVQCILPGFSRLYGKMQFFIAISQYILVCENLKNGGTEEQTREAWIEANEASAIAMKCFSDGVSDIKDLPDINLEYITELECFKNAVVQVAQEKQPNFLMNLADLTIG